MNDAPLIGITWVELLVIGGIFFVLPRIARRGLLFGVYVGEDGSRSDAARTIRRRWYVRGTVLWLTSHAVLAILVATGRPGPALLAPPMLLTAGFVWNYIVSHRRARTLAQVPTAPSVAVLDRQPSSANTVSILTLAACGLIGVASLAFAVSSYDTLPAQMPTHFDASGTPDRWSERSLTSLLLLPGMSLALGLLIGGLALLTAQAKRSIRHTADAATVRAQSRFRLATSRMLGGIALLVTVMLALMSYGQIRVALGQAAGLGPWIAIAPLALGAYAVGGVIYLMVRYGQGGARLERSVANAALTDGLADNRFWKWGLFYVNSEDPSLIVEKRFGLGYTLNFGNSKAILLAILILVVPLGIVVAALLAR